MLSKKLLFIVSFSISIIGCNSGDSSSHEGGNSLPSDTSTEDIVKALSYCTQELAESAPISTNRSYAIKNVNLISMENDQVLPNQTVLTFQDNITWIGNNADAEITNEHIIIDGTNKYLIPGLTDMHVHRAARDELPVYIANGITSIRNLFGFPAHLAIRGEVNSGKILGPRIYTSGSIIDGAIPRWPGSVSVTSAEQAVDIAQQQYDQGYDFLKVYNGLTSDVYRAIIEVGEELDMPVVGHVPSNVGLDLALSSKQRTIEHLDGIGAKLGASESWNWTNINHTDISLITDYLRDFPATYHVPTLVILEKFAYNKQQVETFYNNEKLKYFCSNFIKSDAFNELTSKINNSSDNQVSKSKENYAKKVFIIGEMNKNNVNLVAGSDVGNPLLLPAYSLLDELDIFVQAGLSPYQSLKTTTINAALMLGDIEKSGTIKVGKNADLVLLSDNPLENLSALKNNEGVMIRGQWFERAELNKRLSNLAQHFETAK